MIKIALIQNNILPYRIPLWNLIAESTNISFTIYHYGQRVSPEKELNFEEKKLEFYNLKGFRFIKDFKKIKARYDIIILPFDFHFLNIFTSVFNNKIVLFGHGLGKNKWVIPLRLMLSNIYPLTMLYSFRMRERLIEKGVPKEKLFVLKNTIINYNAGIGDLERKNFLFVGRLQKRKRIDEMIKSFHKILKKIPGNVNFNIVGGEGEQNILNELKQLVKKLNLEKRVFFLGEITDDDALKKVFNSSLAYLCPDNGGLGIVHSFTYGTPLIIKRGFENHGPEYENIIEDKNSLLFDTVYEMEELMVEITIKKDLGDMLSKNSFQFYKENFSKEVYIKSFNQVIKKLIPNDFY